MIDPPTSDCDVMVHRHCEERAPPCKAQIESGSYVTMSRKKVVKNLEDFDELTQFLLEKVREMIYSHMMNDFLRAALMGGEEDTKVTVGMAVISVGIDTWLYYRSGFLSLNFMKS